MAISETSICNMALSRLGAKRLNDLDSDETVNAGLCRTHYEQTRDALLRAHWWGFASDRATLTKDPDEPPFEWEAKFILPDKFLRLKSIYEENNTPEQNTTFSYAIEGERLFTNQTTMLIRYIKQIVDPTKFDALFVEVLILKLAMKLAAAISQDKELQDTLRLEARDAESKASALDRQETNGIGRRVSGRWLDARLIGSRIG